MGIIIQQLEELDQQIMRLKHKGKKIVLTNGCFDVFHPGHDYKLTEAKKHGDVLIVLVNSDNYIQKNKGEKRPINNQNLRISQVAQHPDVDVVMPLPGNCKYSVNNQMRVIMKVIKPHTYASSEEYAPNPIEKPIVDEIGGEIVFIKRYKDYSSSKIIQDEYPDKISKVKHGRNSSSCPQSKNVIQKTLS